MTVQVEIRIPTTTQGERLLVRPVFPDGQLAAAEEILEPGTRATFFLWDQVALQLHTLAPEPPPERVDLNAAGLVPA
jgi:hypothetical protein